MWSPASVLFVVALVAAGRAVLSLRSDRDRRLRGSEDGHVNLVPGAARGYLRVMATCERGSVHLVGGLRSPVRVGRAAVPAGSVPGPLQMADDEMLLRQPAWSPRTLCGLPWGRMADHDDEVELLLARLDTDRPASYVCPYCAAVADADGARL